MTINALAKDHVTKTKKYWTRIKKPLERQRANRDLRGSNVGPVSVRKKHLLFPLFFKVLKSSYQYYLPQLLVIALIWDPTENPPFWPLYAACLLPAMVAHPLSVAWPSFPVPFAWQFMKYALRQCPIVFFISGIVILHCSRKFPRKRIKRSGFQQL